MISQRPANIRFADTKRFTCVVIMLTALFALGVVVNVNTGSVSVPTSEIMKMMTDALRALISELVGNDVGAIERVINASAESKIVFRVRMPRMLLAAILGGGLSVSGFLLQAFFRNPIAGPFVLGISSGAKMAVGVTMIFLSAYIKDFSSASLIAAAFIGSMIITGAVLLFSRKMQNMAMLLVIGIMVGYICGAVTDFCIAFANDQDIVNLTNWSIGSFSGADWKSVSTSATVILLASLAAWMISKPIEAYSLGEGYASSLGVNTAAFRIVLIAVSSLLSGCVTAMAGPVSFVGIAVPHIVRSMLKSAKPALVIPTSFLCGAVFCIFCDLIARTAFAPTELQIGTVTSAFGAPVVVWMMLKRSKREAHQ